MKPVLSITMGDPAGIGAEVTVRALTHPALYELCTPVVIGSAEALRDAARFTDAPLRFREIASPEEAEGIPGTLEYIDPAPLAPGVYAPGVLSAACGDAAFQYVRLGIELAKAGRVAAVVTGPINKEALNLAGHHYDGHTEIFAKFTDTKNYAMLLASGSLRVIHICTHVSLRQACDLVKKERVLDTIRLAVRALQELGIAHGRVAVAGLNPHSSDNGLFGDEEAREILPAIEAARAEGLDVSGPIPPDSVFVRALGGEFDIVVAMYHDQGHIPLKLAGFRMDPKTGKFQSMSGINTTIGLPIIRTSVDHGTAFDRAGRGVAHEGSMIEAIEVAVQMARAKAGER
ncbi:MAG: 4-hydroxythreonine-4-phosphate dehydrogenase PdxA [Ruminococcaceae bacterium]|nr:4-hydroxythreonine-4-phosphate dehydrogenase PdxA [Oscillospiraceae bacterium]